ncbi:hypothetical protein F4813DRAFT_197837 [Daldinia decipiens]|uniref:uncharacterized protein n=1 Tax=Daldinia decipiens TaxID=326647 RepID=UPI0020C32F9E|nr:uncharacterized protein F4813DRAFT_197837 [Daldinia decipiens]KAI1654854.1 hypothetical protein F4813DRAFT_197837 [Daldinia decipiens]
MAETLNPEALSSLSPEYLAEDYHEIWWRWNVALTVIVTVIYILFVISRLFFARYNGWEVWTLYPLSYVSCIGLCILYFLAVARGGAGKHLVYWEIHNPKIIPIYLKLQTASEFLYMLDVSLPKVCIIILYLRIFTERWIRLITKIVLGIVISNYVAIGIIAVLVVCRPFAYKWDKTIDGHCSDLMNSYRYTSLPNIITDVAILILPFPMLYKLQVSPARKFGIFLTLLTGSLGLITAIARFVEYLKPDWMTDPMYAGNKPIILGIIEAHTYFICSCLPEMRPLARGIYRKFKPHKVKEFPYNSGPSFRPVGSNSYGSSVGNIHGNHKTSISALRGQHDDYSKGFEIPAVIQLDKTVHVNYSQKRALPRDMV